MSRSLRQAQLETFAIGLGDTANMTQLAGIAKCYRQVNNQQDLTTAVAYITSLLCGSTSVC